MGKQLEDINDNVNVEVRVKKEEYEEYSRCSKLELDIGKKNSQIELLENKLGFMELEKLQILDEIRLLKQKNDDLEKSTEEEEEKITQLLIENNVLECEKKKAESEIDAWKTKCEELEMRVMELQKKAGTDFNEMELAHEFRGASVKHTPLKQCTDFEEMKRGRKCKLKSSVKKCINFANEGVPCEKIFPTTPGGKPSSIPINISDSEDDLNIPMPKKRRVANIVTSDTESDFEDNLPICSLMKKKILKCDSNVSVSNDSSSSYKNTENTPRRCLIRLGNRKDGRSSRKCFENRNGSKKKFIDDYETENDDSDNESLSGFIVSSTDVSENDSASNSNEIFKSDDPENVSESIMEYDKIISGFRRGRKEKMKWEYEADMLADFGKCSELCMKAMCALYRQQTSEEKSCKATILLNGRGFSQIHAGRGSDFGEFLTDGDPESDVQKSVDELLEFDSKGVEICRHYATHYSKQLFEIYKNNEDPFFRP